MSWSEWFYPIIVTGTRDMWPAVEDSLYLRQECSELFKCEFDVRDDASKVSLHALYGGFP